MRDATPLVARSMAATHYAIHGTVVTVSVPDRAVRETVARIFAGFAVVPHAPPDTTDYRLDRNGEWWAIAITGAEAYWNRSLPDALIALEWHIITDVIARHTDHFHLHGAALLTPTGAASILILGESGSGKTTLTLGLMTRRFLPYADDVVLFDPQMLVPLVFPRAFHIDDYTRELIERLQPTPAWDWDTSPAGYFLPPQWAKQSAPVQAILFPSLQPGATPHLTSMSVADAAMALLPYSATLAQTPGLALATAARLTAHARAYRLVSGDLEATVRAIVDLVTTTRE